MSTPVLTGGCQCGAVRYALDQQPQNVHVCHCRMCQKAVGGPFAIICPVQKSAFRLTRGTLSYFNSSDIARRGFCNACGTPLTFEYPDADDLGVLVGTLDEPDRAPPENQYGNESRVSWYAGLTHPRRHAHLCGQPRNAPPHQQQQSPTPRPRHPCLAGP